MFLNLLNAYLKDRPASQLNAFNAYLMLLNKWNKAYNLTAIHDPHNMVILHILDSLSIEPYLKGNHIIDIGTGAGLPGMILAIANHGKKTRFLFQAKVELHLDNVEIVNERAEKFHNTACFDTIVTRAFATIDTMLEKTKHLCCEDGQFLAMKGEAPLEELKNISDDFEVKAIHQLTIPHLKAQRHLVCIKGKGAKRT